MAKFKTVALTLNWFQCFDVNDQFIHGKKDEIHILVKCISPGEGMNGSGFGGEDGKVIFEVGFVKKGDKVPVKWSETLEFGPDTIWKISLCESDVSTGYRKYDDIGSFSFCNSIRFGNDAIRGEMNRKALSGSAWMDGSGAAYRLTWDATPTYLDED